MVAPLPRHVPGLLLLRVPVRVQWEERCLDARVQSAPRGEILTPVYMWRAILKSIRVFPGARRATAPRPPGLSTAAQHRRYLKPFFAASANSLSNILETFSPSLADVSK